MTKILHVEKANACLENVTVEKNTSVMQVVQCNVNYIRQWIPVWGSTLVSPFDILGTNSVVFCRIFDYNV